MTQDADGVWHDECDWCLADMVNSVGPPAMAKVTAQAWPGAQVARWAVCAECYGRLLRFLADINWNTKAPA